jgi:DNA-binding transcriptional MocR family regulator
MIDFGLGQPQLSLLPLDILQQAATHRLSQGDADILQYGSQQGDGHFRLTLAQFLSEQYDTPVEPEHLFITGGVSQALEMVCSLLTRPGDTIFVEEPSYFLALRIFADHHLNIVGVPIDEDGLIIDALREKLSQYRPTFVYTIPTFHNPSGYTLAADRREELVRLSEQHNFLILADEVYHLLAYAVAPPPPLASYDRAGTVLSLGSFSKILAPGLRLGWMQAQPQVLEPFLLCGFLDSGGGLNPFLSSIVNSVIELGLQHQQLAHLKKTYQGRIVALSEALRQQIPPFTFAEPGGGFFIWGHFPAGVDTTSLLPEATKYEVGFQPGPKFSSTGSLKNYLRLSFAYYGVEDLVEGVTRLARVVPG